MVKGNKTLIGVQFVRNFRNVEYVEQDNDGNNIEKFGLFTEYGAFMSTDTPEKDVFSTKPFSFTGVSVETGKKHALSIISPREARDKELIDDNDFIRARNQDNLIFIDRKAQKLIGFTRRDDITLISMCG